MTHGYNDKQIHGWNGGDCPVHTKTVVEVWFRCKDSDICKANALFWHHADAYDDIIAFKVVKPYVEQKVIRVNEYPDELVAYPDEQSARAGASIRRPPLRIAVKYVEAVNEQDAPMTDEELLLWLRVEDTNLTDFAADRIEQLVATNEELLAERKKAVDAFVDLAIATLAGLKGETHDPL
jgi:hypothetical protein